MYPRCGIVEDTASRRIGLEIAVAEPLFGHAFFSWRRDSLRELPCPFLTSTKVDSLSPIIQDKFVLGVRVHWSALGSPGLRQPKRACSCYLGSLLSCHFRRAREVKPDCSSHLFELDRRFCMCLRGTQNSGSERPCYCHLGSVHNVCCCKLNAG